MLVAFAYTLPSSKASKPYVIAANTKQENCRIIYIYNESEGEIWQSKAIIVFPHPIPKCHPLIFVKVSKNSSMAIIDNLVSFL